jgi:hypothetical protein
MELYADAIEYGVVFGIAEKPRDYGPLLIDIDLEIPIDNYVEGQRLYNEEIIFAIIDKYREVTKRYLDLEPKELVASLFEKPKSTKKETTVKDGFHIIFHGITAHFKLRHIIRYHVVNELSDNQLFKQFVKPVNDIIDKAVVSTNNWLLPGSKKGDGQLYELKAIYDEDNDPIVIENTLADKHKLVSMYSLQHKKRSEENASIFLEDIESEQIDEEYDKIYKKQANYNNLFTDTPISEDKEDQIRRAKFFVSLLSDDRNNTFDAWIKLGWALHNIDNSLLSTWIEFSRRSSKFKEGECE